MFYLLTCGTEETQSNKGERERERERESDGKERLNSFEGALLLLPPPNVTSEQSDGHHRFEGVAMFCSGTWLAKNGIIVTLIHSFRFIIFVWNAPSSTTTITPFLPLHSLPAVASQQTSVCNWQDERATPGSVHLPSLPSSIPTRRRRRTRNRNKYAHLPDIFFSSLGYNCGFGNRRRRPFNGWSS